MSDRKLEVTDSDVDKMADTLIRKMDEVGLAIGNTDRYIDGEWDA